MQRSWKAGLSALAVSLCLAAGVQAQTTGRITGTVKDNSGQALPGVTLTATSTNALGDLVATTEADGSFRFLNVRPGTYEVKASLDGFNTAKQEKVSVGIDATVDLRFELSSAFDDQIVVTSEAPIIDTSNNTTGINANADLFENIPVARNVYDIAQVAPGTAEDGAGTQFYGSTGAENQYVIEGLNTTGIELGTEGVANLNFDFVEGVEVKTGGMNAEYGRITGGVINVITKSGGNEFEGSVFGFYEGGGLLADDTTADKLPATATSVETVDSDQDYGFSLGGFLKRDKLWFFGAYNRLEQADETEVIAPLVGAGTPSVGTIIPRDTESDVYAFKLTGAIAEGHVATFSVWGDPTTIDGNVFTPIRGPEVTYLGTRDVGSEDAVLRYDGVFGSSWTVETVLGRHTETSSFDGAGKNIPQLLDFTQTPSTRENGFPFHSDDDFSRDVLRIDTNKFIGRHEIKFGGDIEDLSAETARYNGGGGQRIYRFADDDGNIYYRHRFFIDDTAPGFDRDNPDTWQISVPLVAEPETRNTSLYLQDSWRMTDTFTLNFGIRYERQEIGDRLGATTIDIDDAWAPRVGLTWDVMGNGRSKLYANYGRFYESIPMDINIRAFGGEVSCFCYNFSADPNDIAPDDNAPRRSSLLGGATPVDPGLQGQYIDEILLGFEYEVRPNLALGVKATYRELGRAIEDFLIASEGNYFVANPGQGLGTEVTFYDYTTAPAPKARREHKSVEFTAQKRMSDNWQLYASYVWSELEGNYDGAFQISTGQLDPNINSAYDYADFMVHSFGRLSSDREHQFKVNGSYRMPDGVLEGLNVGLSAHWTSGFPLNAYGYIFAYDNWESLLAPRGSLGDGPDVYEADLHLDYPIQLNQGREVVLVMDVFNIFDRQEAIRLDERYNLRQDPFCAGIPDSLCSSIGGIANIPGTTNAAGSVDPANATNPDFLKAGVTFSDPRSVRLGVKFRF